jgi:hypothetical protein
MMLQITISNTLLQTTADPAMRGRVISFYVPAYTGIVPLGSLLGGSSAAHRRAKHGVVAKACWPWA